MRIDKRTVMGAGCLVTIGIVLTLMVVTFRAIAGGDVPANPFTTVGVVLELFFAILTTSTYASVVFGSRSRRRFRSYFLWMLALNTLGLLSDVVYWGIGLDFLPLFPQLQEAAYYVCYASAFPLLIFYSTYLISYINEDPKELRRYAVLVGGLSADGLLLVVISVFTAHAEVQPWRLQDYPWLYFFFLALPMVVVITIILNFRRVLTNRKAVSFLCYELLVAAAVAFDTIIGEITLHMSSRRCARFRYTSPCRSATKSSRRSSSSSSAFPSCSVRSSRTSSTMRSPASVRCAARMRGRPSRR